MGQQIENALAIGTIVDSGNVKYRIEKVLGQGGFGITYKVTASKMDGNIPIEVTYALKEFYMKDYSDRDKKSGAVISTAKSVALSRKSFLSEARRLASIKHKNIVAVNEVFEANNTAYYVMQYLEGESLYKYLDTKRSLSVSEALQLMSPIFDAVSYLHKNRFTHLDIKPDNIMLTKNRDGVLKPILIDFGLSKHYDAQGNETSVLQQICVSPGYSPFEQYLGIHTFTPQADVYALAATLYRCLTGSVPPDCRDYRDEPKSMLPVIAKGLANVDTHIREAILSAMKSSKIERTQSVAAFVAHLNQSADIPEFVEDPNATIEIPIPEPVDPKKILPIKDPNPPRPHKLWDYINPVLQIIGIFIIGGLVFVAIMWVASRGGSADEPIDTNPYNPINTTATASSSRLPDKAVDLGLSVLWSDRNVGASSPSDYGGYYAWGETSTKSDYSWSTYTHCDGSYNTCHNIGSNIAGSRYDVARQAWGGGWKIPTKAQWEELENRCTWTWTTEGGHSGYKVTGPNGNSIFLPAAGSHFFGTSSYYGYYWSSTLFESGTADAWQLHFDSGDHSMCFSFRDYGRTVRPVTEK
ncbi:MAG: serine/threonine protein kinase [Muribaculaceae bacterium]|nr:serine/threonine protein kinase [Muribaculaceae bacterium]